MMRYINSHYVSVIGTSVCTVATSTVFSQIGTDLCSTFIWLKQIRDAFDCQ